MAFYNWVANLLSQKTVTEFLLIKKKKKEKKLDNADPIVWSYRVSHRWSICLCANSKKTFAFPVTFLFWRAFMTALGSGAALMIFS